MPKGKFFAKQAQSWGRTPYPWSPRLRGIIQLSRIGNVLRKIWLILESLQFWSTTKTDCTILLYTTCTRSTYQSWGCTQCLFGISFFCVCPWLTRTYIHTCIHVHCPVLICITVGVKKCLYFSVVQGSTYVSSTQGRYCGWFLKASSLAVNASTAYCYVHSSKLHSCVYVFLDVEMPVIENQFNNNYYWNGLAHTIKWSSCNSLWRNDVTNGTCIDSQDVSRFSKHN